MLNYRNTSAVFLLLNFIYFSSGINTSFVATIIYCSLAFVYIFLLILGSARIQTNFYLNALHKGNPAEAKVALTFDDGPDKQTSDELLSILDKHKIKATFFMIGSKIEGNEQILQNINNKGHLIGNHSWSHSWLFDFFLPSKMISEIKKTDAAIEDITGSQVKFFRPPYGVTNPFLSKALKRTGHIVVGWSLKTFDTSKNKHKVLNRIETRLKNGDIILFHDTKPNTIELLDEAISMIRKKGMEIVAVDELL